MSSNVLHFKRDSTPPAFAGATGGARGNVEIAGDARHETPWQLGHPRRAADENWVRS